MGFNPNKRRKHTIKFTKRLQNFVMCVHALGKCKLNCSQTQDNARHQFEMDT